VAWYSTILLYNNFSTHSFWSQILKVVIFHFFLSISRVQGNISQIASDIEKKKGAEPLLTLPPLASLAGGFPNPPPEGALKGGGP
jgi:hypothetical protein